MNAKIAVIITCEKNGVPQEIILTNVEENTINEQSTLTTYPTVSGDMIADHMYKEPASISIRGTFGNNGNPGFLLNGATKSLKEIERYFLEIKNEAILCNIVKSAIDTDNESLSFKKINQCALTSITWTEGINTLKFDLSFTQVIAVEVQEYDYDIISSDLPPITEPAAGAFTEMYIDWNDVDKIVLEKLKKDDMITDDFINKTLIATGVAVVGGVLIGVGAAVTASTWGAILAGGASAGPIGWIILGVALLIAGVAAGITNYNNAQKRQKYKIEQFKYYEEDAKNQAELERFTNYIGNIHKAIYSINDKIKIYNITESINQELVLSVDNYYYSFNFKKDNVENNWKLDINDSVNNLPARSGYNCEASPICYLDCTSSNALFRVPNTGTYVYLIRYPREKMMPGGKTDDDLKRIRNDLTDYYIVTSTIDPQTFNEKLENTIYDAMTL